MSLDTVCDGSFSRHSCRGASPSSAPPHIMARKVSRATRSANGRLAHDPLYMWCIRRRRSGEPALDHSVERIDDDRQEVRDAAVKTTAPQSQRFLQPATRRTATAMRYPAARTNHKLAPDAIGVEQFCVQPCVRRKSELQQISLSDTLRRDSVHRVRL